MTRSLETMVANAIVSTIIKPVAAESSPIKAVSAKIGRCSFIAMVNTNVSASTPPSVNSINPANAIGSTKRLISSR